MTSHTSTPSRSHISATLVDQPDIDAAEGVLEKLHHLGRACRGNRYHGVDGVRRTALDATSSTGRSGPADDLGGISRVPLFVSRIDSLRRKSEEEILPHLQTAFFQCRQDELLGRAGIGRALENDELSRPKTLRNLLCRVDNERQIRVLGLGEWGRDANDNGVLFVRESRNPSSQSVGRTEPTRKQSSPEHPVRRNHPSLMVVDFARADIDTCDRKPRRRELHRQRQTYIAQTHGCEFHGTSTILSFMILSCMAIAFRLGADKRGSIA